MKRSMLCSAQSFRRRKLVALTAGLIVASSWNSISACQYCDQCDGGIVCDSGCDSGCDSCCSSGRCQITKALDRFAGGVEKFLGFDKCGSSCGCDGGCDAAIMSDLMIPVERSHKGGGVAAPTIPTVPPESYSPEPRSTEEIVEPYTEPAPLAPQPDPAPHAPSLDPNSTAPAPESEPRSIPQPQREPGSIFDTLDDPFGDDQARRSSSQRYLRTSMNDKRAQAQTPHITTWKPVSQKTTFSTGSHHNHHVQSQTRANSLKRAAGRKPVHRNSVAKRTTHNQPSPHQSRTATRQTKQVHHMHQAKQVHQKRAKPSPTRHVQHTHQVRLSAAPKPKSQYRPLRTPTGQRHTVAPAQGYGHSTAKQSYGYAR